MKWNKIELRPATKEEKEEYGHVEWWDGLVPEEDEEVLVTDGKRVWTDIWVWCDAYSCGWESDASSITHWMPFPEPPKEE